MKSRANFETDIIILQGKKEPEIIMKLVLALLSLIASVSANIPATSDVGRKLMSEARRVEDADAAEGDNQYDQYNDNNGQSYNSGSSYQENGDAFGDDWISGYSIKFQGCHHISQWNTLAEDEDDVRIATKRLVRFRLCPTDSCNPKSNAGCNSAYGDYVLDMNTYLSYYFEAKETYQSFQCEYLANYACGCENSNNQNSCLYSCFAEHGMEKACMNGGADDDAAAASTATAFNLEDYMTCTQSNYTDVNGNSLYIGPYCGEQGGAIYLGVFTDEDCTNVAGASKGGADAYFYASGSALPYAKASILDMDCMSCLEPTDNNYSGNDADDADDVANVCEAVYTLSGKCEQAMYNNANQNNNACGYLEGIKISREDGTIVTADLRANRTAGTFVFLFTAAFVGLSVYTYHLKKKLDRSSVNLNE
jgi:hypothetical protein